MKWRLFRLNPITRRRLQRFRRSHLGFWSLIVLAVATFISLFAELIANDRAIVVRYEGKLFFPTYTAFIPMNTFGQMDDWGLDDAETNYRQLREDFKGTANWVLMPPIPFDPYELDLQHYDNPPPQPPDSRHLLGTDAQGRDVVARLLYGFRTSMLFALMLVTVSTIVGATIGLLLGYIGSLFDLLGQRLIEIWSNLPVLYILVLLAAFFRPNFWMLLLVMTLFNWTAITYYMRTETYREKAREYALGARAIGASHFRVVFRHILPNALTPLVTLVPFEIVGAITALTALDFLGYGLPPPTPSWGELIDQALVSTNRDKLWLSLSPFIALTVTLTLIVLVGEAVREAFDPKETVKYQ